MTRASLTGIVASSPLVRVVRAEEFDLLVTEIEELRRRDRERVDLAYQERTAVVAWLRGPGWACGDDAVTFLAGQIERGEHRREEGA